MARDRLQRRQLVAQRRELLGRQHAAKVNPPSFPGNQRQVAACVDDETRHLLADERWETALDVHQCVEQCRVERLRTAFWIRARGPLDVAERSARSARTLPPPPPARNE